MRAFCFSENDIVVIFILSALTSQKLKIIFANEEDFEEAKQAIESELLFFASDLKIHYYQNSQNPNSSPREGNKIQIKGIII